MTVLRYLQAYPPHLQQQVRQMIDSDRLGEYLQRDIEHDLPRSEFMVPMGVGVRYALTDKLGLNLESAYRHISTDYLDGFSQAGNPRRDDAYFKFSAGLSYQLGKKDPLDCPVVRF